MAVEFKHRNRDNAAICFRADPLIVADDRRAAVTKARTLYEADGAYDIHVLRITNYVNT